MKTESILTKERIIIIVAGILLLAAGAVYRFSPDLPAVSSTGNKVERIVKYQKRAAMLPVLEERLPAVAASTEKGYSRLISEPSSELAGVAIQNILRDAASRQDIEFISINTRKTDQKSYRYVNVIFVQVAFKAQIRQLKNMLYHIEAHPMLLSIPELRIVKPAAGKSDDLNIVMTIQGFSRKEK